MKKKINPQAMQIADYLHDWLEHYVPSIKACSPHTKRNYKISVKLYVEFLRVIKRHYTRNIKRRMFLYGIYNGVDYLVKGK